MRYPGMAAGLITCVALSTSCGDTDECKTAKCAAAQPSGGAGMSGAAHAGSSSGATAGDASSAGSTGMADAGEPNGGVPGQAGAPPAGGEGGSPADDGVIAREQAAPTGLALDAKNVYWGNSSGAGAIVTCPLAGCGAAGPTTVVENAGEVRGIAVDATSVYWLIAANQALMAPIRKCPLTGCAGQPVTLGDVSSMRPNDVHVVGTQLFYTAWPDFSYCSTTNCAPNARTSLGAMPVVSVDVDAGFIYFSRYGNQIVSRCSRPACSDLTDLVKGHAAVSVAVDATTLYFSKLGFFGINAVNDPGIYQCPLEGCGDSAPEPVLAGVSAFAIALSPTRLFYTDVEAGIVASIPK